jgi:hypothetical protein
MPRRILDASYLFQWFFPGGLRPDLWTTELGLPFAGHPFDLGLMSSLPGALQPEEAEIEFSWEALPNLFEGSVITATVEDSANGLDFAATGFVKRLVGQPGGGYPAGGVAWPLAASLRRYVRLHVYAPDAGDCTGQMWRFCLVF